MLGIVLYHKRIMHPTLVSYPSQTWRDRLPKLPQTVIHLIIGCQETLISIKTYICFSILPTFNTDIPSEVN